MPITMPIKTRRVTQEEFAALAYEVMGNVFSIHDEFGRFFDERIYKRELADRMHGIQLEVPVTVSFGDFMKTYFLDVLDCDSGLFEFKSVDSIHPRHRGQTLNYLMLANLGHAKIINVRPEQVEHEFVNCNHILSELRNPQVVLDRWIPLVPGASQFEQVLRTLISDWGTGLELPLYEAALSHFLHCPAEIAVNGSRQTLGFQRMRLAAPNVAFKLTAFA